MERGLIRIAGEDDSLGRPYLYQTTRRFLEVFGLRSLDDLPIHDELTPRRLGENRDESDVDSPGEHTNADATDTIADAGDSTNQPSRAA
jgi:segregation and condensation protein B